MEYERAREITAVEIARAVDVKQLVQGHRLTQEFFARTQAEPGSTELKPNRELRDTPPPIVYDDEFGKSTVSFSRIKTGRAVMPVFEMKYQDEGGKPIYLLDYAKEGFYFAETPKGFSTLSVLGDPVVFFNYGLLASSRNFLLALGHEMGHTQQGQTEHALWRIVRPGFTRKDLTRLRNAHPQQEEYIDDLVRVLGVALEEDPAKKRQLALRVRNTGAKGLNMRWLDVDLPERVEEVLSVVTDAPLGPAHPAGFFNTVKANLPAMFDIFDPMEERMAWEYAIPLDKSMDEEGIMHCGFKSPEERVLFMRRNLETYDRHNGVNNYTRWLNEVNAA